MQKNNQIAKKNSRIGSFVLLLALCLICNVLAAQTGTVTFNLKKVSVSDVFREIEKQSSYRFFYNTSAVSEKHNLDLNVTSKPISDILNDLFKGTSLNYKVVNNYIVITTAEGNEDEQFRKIVVSKSIQVKGTLRGSSDNEPLAGVVVVEQGTPNATTTDADGNYSIKVAGSSSQLSFSYIGFTPAVENVGIRSTIDVILDESQMVLGEVVVTALGISREAKSLTYNVQDFSSKEITTVKDANFINSLQGKIAGVTINSSASGVGGSSRVVMRGTKSLFGNNDALYVIDGVAMPNLKSEQPTDFYKVPDHGDNDGISHVNPDDIENISVLTGSAAAALYGNQGANGVILITTKKGTADKLTVNLSNNTSFMNPFILPKFQNTYGREEGSYQSWGSKLATPSSYDPADFFQTGYSTTNSLSVSFGTQKNNTYASIGTVNSEGTIPNNEYSRYNFAIRNTSKVLNDKMTIDLNASYMTQEDQNMRAQGQYHNPLVPIYLFPPSDDIEKYKIYERYNIDRNFNTQYWPYGNQGMGMQNPYWVINRSMFNHERRRNMIGGQVKYEIADWLNVSARVKSDITKSKSTKRFYASSDGIFAGPSGHYMNHESTTEQTYADLMANIDKTFGDFRLVSVVGANLTDTKYSLHGYEGDLLKVPNFFHYSNIDRSNPDKTKATEDGYHDQIQAMFATAQLGYKGMLYLDLTGRIDWPSMLYGADESSVVYPSVGLSGIITEMVNLRSTPISFLKARVSYSGVGNPPKRWIANKSSYSVELGQISMFSYPSAHWLTPERTNSTELGLNMKLFNNKLSLDATYYNSKTHNQLFEYVPAPSTGFSTMYINAGHVRNYGIEASLGYNQDLGRLSWNTNVVFSLNRNKIIKLLSASTIDGINITGSDKITVSSALNHAYEMVLSEGGTASDIYVKGLRTDSQGNIWVSSSTGEVQISDTPIKAGKASPDYNVGWRNSFKYKSLDFGFLVDARVGGIVVSATQSYLDGYGVSQATADARDRGYVHINGEMPVNPSNYYQAIGGGQTLAPYVYSATNVRLREASISYSLPSAWFNDIARVSLSLTGHNLWMIYNRAPYDPEVAASTGTYYQGFDYFMMPSMRSLGFGVKVQF